MAISKSVRLTVWKKSNGLCWYCGSVLPDKCWHVDHVEPVRRESKIQRNAVGLATIVPAGTMEHPENDNITNMVPACAPCNLFKSTFTVEHFRAEIGEQVARGRKTSVNWRTAERFSQIVATPAPVVFWFENNEIEPGH